MKITGFTSSEMFSFPLPGKDGMVTPATVSPDIVNLQALSRMDMSDADAQALLDETVGMISQDSVAALSVHSGLNAERVAALLRW